MRSKGQKTLMNNYLQNDINDRAKLFFLMTIILKMLESDHSYMDLYFEIIR